MKKIYKYQLRGVPDSNYKLEMPLGAKIVHIGIQLNILCLWVEVDPDEKSTFRYFRIYGTGHKISANALYLGTVFDEPYVWHVYEELS